MIVECINDNWEAKETEDTLPAKNPKKGELCHVVEECHMFGVHCYDLYEYNNGWVYEAVHFKQVTIDISDAESKKLNELPIECLI